MENYGKKIKDVIRSINNNSHDYDENYVEMKVKSDENLTLKKDTRIA